MAAAAVTRASRIARTVKFFDSAPAAMFSCALARRRSRRLIDALVSACHWRHPAGLAQIFFGFCSTQPGEFSKTCEDPEVYGHENEGNAFCRNRRAAALRNGDASVRGHDNCHQHKRQRTRLIASGTRERE